MSFFQAEFDPYEEWMDFKLDDSLILPSSSSTFAEDTYDLRSLSELGTPETGNTSPLSGSGMLGDTCDGEGDGKKVKSKFLERNRVAASKCRQKKKQRNSELEVSCRKAAQTHRSLVSAIAMLKDEVLTLKGEMLKHTDCDCGRIRTYLNMQADQLTCN